MGLSRNLDGDDLYGGLKASWLLSLVRAAHEPRIALMVSDPGVTSWLMSLPKNEPFLVAFLANISTQKSLRFSLNFDQDAVRSPKSY